MRQYEVIYILRPDVDDEVANDVKTRMGGIVEAGGGKINQHETWGRKKLAYAVRRHPKGIFMYLLFEGEPACVAEVERTLRLIEPVMKHQMVRLDGAATGIRPFMTDSGEGGPTEEEGDSPMGGRAPWARAGRGDDEGGPDEETGRGAEPSEDEARV